MKNWFNNNYRQIIVTTFLVPIIIVAIVSISHVTQWYNISNPLKWSIYLSIGVEIAALSSLSALSVNLGKKVYLPFMIVTFIQLIGNIFFAYKFIDINSDSFKLWVELISPLGELFNIQSTNLVSHRRLLSILSGGFLPLISLLFLHMLVNFTEKKENIDNQEIDKKILDEKPVLLSDEQLSKIEKYLSEKQPKEYLKPILKPIRKKTRKKKRNKEIIIEDNKPISEVENTENILSTDNIETDVNVENNNTNVLNENVFINNKEVIKKKSRSTIERIE